MKKLNLAVVFGGKSDEHEVSLKGAREVMNNLDPEKYNVIPIAVTKKGNWLVGDNGSEYMKLNLPNAQTAGGVSVEQSQGLVTTEGSFPSEDLISSIDLFLPIGAGAFIEDGTVQGMFEAMDQPYVFSGVLASALAMNKSKTKVIAKSAGLKVAKEMILNKNKKYNLENVIKKIGLPAVTKPTTSGSSVGISISDSAEKLDIAIKEAFAYGSEVMIEQFIKGRELTAAVIGNKNPKALPIVEIIPKISTFFDYKAKYEVGGSEEVCPANIPDDIAKKAQKYAIKIFKSLGCRDLSRADFIWSATDNKLYFLEINTIPGMTSASLAPKAAKAAGYSFGEFLDKIIGEALKRYK